MAKIDKDLLAHLEGMITKARKERFLKILSLRTRFLTVALEDVYQMHNASAVIRSCDAVGIQEAHLIEGRFGKRLDKNIAMGAQKWVDICRHKTSRACIDTLRSRGYRIVATVPRDNAKSLYDFTPEAIYIPMLGFTESLNVSVAAAILLQELRRRLNTSDIRWGLTGREILEKRFDWTCKSIHSVEEIIGRYYGDNPPPSADRDPGCFPGSVNRDGELL